MTKDKPKSVIVEVVLKIDNPKLAGNRLKSRGKKYVQGLIANRPAARWEDDQFDDVVSAKIRNVETDD